MRVPFVSVLILALFSCTSSSKQPETPDGQGGNAPAQGGDSGEAGSDAGAAGDRQGSGATGGEQGSAGAATAGRGNTGGATAGQGNTGGATAGSSSGGGSGRDPLNPDDPPYIGTGIELTEAPYDWVGIIGSGQSLSIGAYSTAVSVTQPYKNLMLIDNGPDPKYPIDGSASAQWSAVPLMEPHRPNIVGTVGDVRAYPNNIFGWAAEGPYGETPHSGMASAISKTWDERGRDGDYVTVHSAVGVGGYAIDYINKGTHTYDAALAETKVYKRLADEAGKVYGMGAVIFTHGESDTTLGTSDYGDKVHRLWSDFNTDLKAITQQPNNIVLLASQQSSVRGGYNSPSIQLWRAGRAHPGEVVCTGPKYAYGPYYIHPTGPDYQRIGEKYGEVYDLIVNQGKAWRPLGPNKAEREGKVITVDFDVPNPPLVWDEHLPAPHQGAHQAWSAGKGFEVIDASGNELQIESAEINGNSVQLTLTQEPTSALTVGYAVTADDAGGAYAGGASDLIGLLRDSDPFQGYSVEQIEVDATSGSDVFTASAGALARRTGMDIVSGEGLPAGTVVKALPADSDSVTLSAEWGGATGKANLTFRHNHYNYCVHFALDVP